MFLNAMTLPAEQAAWLEGVNVLSIDAWGLLRFIVQQTADGTSVLEGVQIGMQAVRLGLDVAHIVASLPKAEQDFYLWALAYAQLYIPADAPAPPARA